MKISKEVLLGIYPPELHEDVELLYTPMPKGDPIGASRLLAKRIASPLFRINYWYQIVDRHGSTVRFELNLPQHKVLSVFLVHNRPIILKSRQQGITTLFCVVFIDMIIHSPNLTTGIITVDQTIAQHLLVVIKRIWGSLHPTYKNALGLTEVSDNTNKLKLSNGSSIDVKTTFRGTTLHALHVSEMGKIANQPGKVKEVINGSFQAVSPNNPLIIESTAEGHNHFKIAWDEACQRMSKVPGVFYPIFLSWLDDPYFTSDNDIEPTDEESTYLQGLESEIGYEIPKDKRNYWLMKRREVIGSDAFYQEYPATASEAFTLSIEGSYWSRIFNEYIVAKNRVVPNLVDPIYPLYASLDLGYSDDTVIILFQVIEGSVHIVNEVIRSQESVDYYIALLNSYDHPIECVYLPHDANQSNMIVGKSIMDMFRQSCRHKVNILQRESGIVSRDTVRKTIPSMRIDKKCTRVIAAFINYRTVYDEDKGVLSNKPVHDSHSHVADAIRYMCQAIRDFGLIRASQGSRYLDENVTKYGYRLSEKAIVSDLATGERIKSTSPNPTLHI